MKKFLSAILFALMIVTVAPAQAHSSVDLNPNFGERLSPVSYIYGGKVVGITTYLSVRERPNVNSREVLRIPNGTKLTLRVCASPDWWQVVAINGNFCDGIGYVSARYIRID